MNTRNTKRLMLHKETLRNLQDAELRQVVGGVDGGKGYPELPIVTHGTTCSCPPPGGGFNEDNGFSNAVPGN